MTIRVCSLLPLLCRMSSLSTSVRSLLTALIDLHPSVSHPRTNIVRRKLGRIKPLREFFFNFPLDRTAADAILSCYFVIIMVQLLRDSQRCDADAIPPNLGSRVYVSIRFYTTTLPTNFPRHPSLLGGYRIIRSSTYLRLTTTASRAGVDLQAVELACVNWLFHLNMGWYVLPLIFSTACRVPTSKAPVYSTNANDATQYLIRL